MPEADLLTYGFASKSHLRGMSWYTPSGNVLRTVIGSIPVSSSLRAMSMGLDSDSGSMSMGAPIDI